MSLPVPTSTEPRLPVPRTSLIGREQDAERVSDLLLTPDVSLVSVVGPGGAGKTRLAIEIAHRLTNDFRDGVWLVPLSTIIDHNLVVPAIAQTIGLRESGDDSVRERLLARLRESEMLIVLDNFEQVRDAAIEISRLLDACRNLKLLITSRVVLRLSSEHVYPITGLSLPGPETTTGIDAFESNPAVQLFVARARSSDPEFQLTEQSLKAVGGILRQVDGLPLGIELAAARIRMLSPQALHARLSRRLTVLGSRFHDIPDRHRTIGDAVDWSVQLLTPEERTIFDRLSVFAGDFTLVAAEAVAGDGDGLDVLDALGSLVDQSLVRHVSAPSDEESVYRVLRIIREVGQEHLEVTGELAGTRQRHAAYFLAYSEEAASHLTGPEQVRFLNDLERAMPDLRKAMNWFEETGQGESMLRLAVAHWRFGYTRGHLAEAREWLRSALAANPEPSPLRAAALNAKGLLASSQGDTAIAMACHEEALAISRKAGSELGVAVALNGLGDVAAADGERKLARERYEGALLRFRALGDVRNVAGALTNLGNLSWDEQDLEGAMELHEDAARHFAEVEDLRGLAWAASNLGTLAIQLGQYDAGNKHLRDALEMYTDLGDPFGIVLTLEGFSEIAQARGYADVEARLHGAGNAARERLGIPVTASDRERYDAGIDRLRRKLGDAFQTHWAVGRAMASAEAIELALTLADGSLERQARREPQAAPESFGLTRREVEIVQLIAVGKSNKEISDELSISYRTVSTHVSNILGKLDLANRSALASFAHRQGIVSRQ